MKQREQVKKVAVRMIEQSGLINLSRRELCEKAFIPDGSFPHIMNCNFSDFVEELRLEGTIGTPHSVSKTRANPELRKSHILNVAVCMAKTEGYNKITRDKVAEGAGVSTGLVSRYFGTMIQLKTAIMRRAVKQGIVEIIAQGLIYGDDHARKAPIELKEEAAAFLANL